MFFSLKIVSCLYVEKKNKKGKPNLKCCNLYVDIIPRLSHVMLSHQFGTSIFLHLQTRWKVKRATAPSPLPSSWATRSSCGWPWVPPWGRSLACGVCDHFFFHMSFLFYKFELQKAVMVRASGSMVRADCFPSDFFARAMYQPPELRFLLVGRQERADSWSWRATWRKQLQRPFVSHYLRVRAPRKSHKL